MIGKLLGKAVGTAIALPAIVAKELDDANDAVWKANDRAWDRLEGKRK